MMELISKITKNTLMLDLMSAATRILINLFLKPPHQLYYKFPVVVDRFNNDISGLAEIDKLHETNKANVYLHLVNFEKLYFSPIHII